MVNAITVRFHVIESSRTPIETSLPQADAPTSIFTATYTSKMGLLTQNTMHEEAGEYQKVQDPSNLVISWFPGVASS